MKRRQWLAIGRLAVLASLFPAPAKSQERRAKAPVPTIKLIAICEGVRATNKRRQTWIFQFKVLSVIQGRYEEPFVGFELVQGGPTAGDQLLAILGAKRNAEGGNVIDFNHQKKVELTFEARSSKSIQQLDLRSFRGID